MFGPVGLPEILVILVIALLVFGPRRLPEVGRKIGAALGEFRRATHDLKRTIDTEVTLEEVRQKPSPSPPAAPSPPASEAFPAAAPADAAATAATAAPAESPDAGAEGDASD